MSAPVQHNSSHPAPFTDSSLSPTQARVVAALAQGHTVSAAARQADIHRTTIHHWLRNAPEFKAAVKAARRESAERLNDQLRELASTALKTLRKLLDDPATPSIVRMKTALAILERPHSPDSDWRLPDRSESPRPSQIRSGEIEAEVRAMLVSS